MITLARRILVPLLLLRPAAPLRRRILATWEQPSRRGPLARLVFEPLLDAHLERAYWLEPDPERREAVKAELLGGGGAGALAAYYDADEGVAQPLWDVLCAVLADSAPGTTVVQVGSSSGRELAAVAERFPHATCIGVEPFADAVAYASSEHAAPNLTFRVGSAQEIGEVLAGVRGPLVVVSSGTLQYVQPEHLTPFFARIGEVAGAQVVAYETVSDAQGDPLTLGGSRPRANLTWSHDLPHYLREAGLRVVELRIDYPFRESGPEWRADTGNLLVHASA